MSDKNYEEKKKEMYKRIYRDVYEKFQCDKKTLMELFQAFQQEIEPEIRSDATNKERERIEKEIKELKEPVVNDKTALVNQVCDEILKIVRGK